MKLFGGLKEKIDGLFAAATGFLGRLKKKSQKRGIKSPFTFAVIGLLILLAGTGIIALAVTGGSEKENERLAETVIPENKPLAFTHEPLPPNESLMPARQSAGSPEDGDYRLFRPRVKQWSAKDAEQWFTPPNEAMFEQLHAANNALIQSMLDSAP
jgi:hypothetical protein